MAGVVGQRIQARLDVLHLTELPIAQLGEGATTRAGSRSEDVAEMGQAPGRRRDPVTPCSITHGVADQALCRGGRQRQLVLADRAVPSGTGSVANPLFGTEAAGSLQRSPSRSQHRAQEDAAPDAIAIAGGIGYHGRSDVTATEPATLDEAISLGPIGGVLVEQRLEVLRRDP